MHSTLRSMLGLRCLTPLNTSSIRPQKVEITVAEYLILINVLHQRKDATLWYHDLAYLYRVLYLTIQSYPVPYL